MSRLSYLIGGGILGAFGTSQYLKKQHNAKTTIPVGSAAQNQAKADDQKNPKRKQELSEVHKKLAAELKKRTDQEEENDKLKSQRKTQENLQSFVPSKDGVRQKTKQMAGQARTKTASAVNEGRQAVDRVGDKMQEIKDMRAKEVQQGVKLADEKAEANKGLIDKGKSMVSNKVDQIKHAASDKVENVKETISDKIEEEKKAVKDAVSNKVEQGKNAIKRAVSQKVEVAKDAVGEKLVQGKQAIKEVMNSESAEKTLAVIGEKVQQGKQILKEKAVDIREALDEKAQEMKERAENETKNAQNTAHDVWEEGKSRAGNKLASAKNTANDKIQQAKNQVKQKAGQAGGLVEKGKDVLQSAKKTVNDKVEEGKNFVSQKYNENEERIQKGGMTALGKTKEAAQDLSRNARRAANQVSGKVDEIANHMRNDNTEEAVKSLKQAKNQLHQRVEDTKETMLHKAVAVGTDMVKSVAPAAVDRAKGLVEDIQDKKAELMSDKNFSDNQYEQKQPRKANQGLRYSSQNQQARSHEDLINTDSSTQADGKSVIQNVKPLQNTTVQQANNLERLAYKHRVRKANAREEADEIKDPQIDTQLRRQGNLAHRPITPQVVEKAPTKQPSLRDPKEAYDQNSRNLTHERVEKPENPVSFQKIKDQPTVTTVEGKPQAVGKGMHPEIQEKTSSKVGGPVKIDDESPKVSGGLSTISESEQRSKA